MIQDLDYTKRKKRNLPLKPVGDTGLNLIRVADEITNFSSMTGAGDPEPEENENGLTAPQQSYLDALDQTKTKARERAPFLFKTPEKPELDEEQRKRYKNLTKAGALAQLVDAVSDMALGARNKDYSPVPIAGDELAFSGLQRVYEMDQEHRNEMRNYDERVFSIGERNRQAEHQTEEFNQDAELQAERQNNVVDLNKIQAEMGFEQANAELEAVKKQFEYDKKNEEQKRYFDSGLRLISQGEEEAALTMLEKAGLNTKEARELLGTDKSRGGDSTVISRLNQFMGYDGEKNSVSNLQLNMLKDYKSLRDQIDKDGYDVHFNEMTGDPRTGKGRDLLQMEKELGALRFVPDDMVKGEGGNQSKEKSVNPGGQWRMDQDGLIDPEQSNSPLPKLNSLDLSSRQSAEELNNYVRSAASLIMNTQDEQGLISLAEKIEKDLQDAGLSDEEVDQIGQMIFQVRTAQTETPETNQKQNKPEPQVGPGSVYR